jgi:hypothetical protein
MAVYLRLGRRHRVVDALDQAVGDLAIKPVHDAVAVALDGSRASMTVPSCRGWPQKCGEAGLPPVTSTQQTALRQKTPSLRLDGVQITMRCDLSSGDQLYRDALRPTLVSPSAFGP